MKKVWIYVVVIVLIGFILFLLFLGGGKNKKLEKVDITNDLVLFQSATKQPDGSILLVPAENGKSGMAAYLPAITSDLEVTFDLKIGGGDGADGMVLAFYASTRDIQLAGGNLNFNGSGGYGIEFDIYSNTWDPSYPHVALIQNNVQNHIKENIFEHLRDEVWHKVNVSVVNNHLLVKVDGNTYINITQEFKKENPYLYFAATTGLDNDNHYIRNVVISATINSNKKLDTSNLLK